MQVNAREQAREADSFFAVWLMKFGFAPTDKDRRVSEAEVAVCELTPNQRV
jgi:hypothetical protein